MNNLLAIGYTCEKSGKVLIVKMDSVEFAVHHGQGVFTIDQCPDCLSKHLIMVTTE